MDIPDDIEFDLLIDELDDDFEQLCTTVYGFNYTITQLLKQLEELKKRRNFILSTQSDLLDDYKELQENLKQLRKTVKQVVNTYNQQYPE